MGEKSEQKKQHIIEAARNVFIEKGYRSVTMKDIVDACEISRGGLYLYFSSTEEIFKEVLKYEAEEDDDVFSAHITEEATATDILTLFFKEQKKELLRKKDDLSIATFEFFFAEDIPKKENILKQKFDAGRLIIQKLIEAGMENGEFYDVDAKAVASNIMFVIEGLRIVSKTVGLTEGMIDNEFNHVLQELCVEVQ